MTHPTSADVIAFLNEQLAAAGLPDRVEAIAVLPYMNPMWLANWEAPSLAALPEADAIIREARWQFPQVLLD
jgi:hypothetical protein